VSTICETVYALNRYIFSEWFEVNVTLLCSTLILYYRVNFLEWNFTKQQNLDVIGDLTSDFDSRPGKANMREIFNLRPPPPLAKDGTVP
jgi:hypothetical protein